MVLNCVVAVVSFRRGDMALAVVFTGVALSFLGPLMRSSSGGDDDSDRRSPLAS
ncbi:hypothetical protein [Actinomyces viscosus]|uniref:hypothetical protein n=1 Tax=Actinomyces viscosus TaxID=1656 RepID=UPI001FD6B9BA|nr:hypothetical protein [Actinomyces viscosus]